MVRSGTSARNPPVSENNGVPSLRTTAATATMPWLDLRRPVWRRVLILALPVLAQQLLIFSVGFSDRILAGRLEPMPRQEQAAALSYRLGARMSVSGHIRGNGLASAPA